MELLNSFAFHNSFESGPFADSKAHRRKPWLRVISQMGQLVDSLATSFQYCRQLRVLQQNVPLQTPSQQAGSIGGSSL